MELLTTLGTGDKLIVDGALVFVDRMPIEFTFAWLTDIHVGKAFAYDPNSPQAEVDHIASQLPSFIIVSGDCSEDGTVEQLQAYASLFSNITVPCYTLPGNHDEVGSYDDPPPNDYSNYTAVINSFRWAFTFEGCRFIGFTTNLKRSEPYRGMGWVSQEDRDFVESSLSPTGRNFLFTHFPFADGMGNNVRDWYNQDSGQVWLKTLAESCNITLFTGHRHRAGISSWQEQGYTELNGGCLAYNEADGRGSYNLVTIEGNSLTVNEFYGRSPYSFKESIVIDTSP